MLLPDIDEALRYLGVPTPAPAALRAQAERISRTLCAQIQPRWVYRVFPLLPEHSGFTLSGTGVSLSGGTARTMLSQCRGAAVLACTLGAPFDALLRAQQARDMAGAAILDALGSALVEAGCTAAGAELSARLPGQFLTDRFSPGYGDLPLDLQPALCALLDAGRRLGITVGQSLLMNPCKSVTAVIGLADAPQPARVRGCAYCALRERCRLRQVQPCGSGGGPPA